MFQRVDLVGIPFWGMPGLVNIQKAIENGHKHSGFSHEKL